jgi:hypothetical protein
MGCIDGEEVGMKQRRELQLSHKPLVCGRIIYNPQFDFPWNEIGAYTDGGCGDTFVRWSSIYAKLRSLESWQKSRD